MKKRIESIIKVSSGADKEALLKMINEHLAKQGVPLYTLDEEDSCFKLLNLELTDEEVDRVDYFCASEIVNSAICLAAELNPNITMHGKLLYNDGYASEIAFVSYDASRRELSVETAHEGDYPACPHCETPSHGFSANASARRGQTPRHSARRCRMRSSPSATERNGSAASAESRPSAHQGP